MVMVRPPALALIVANILVDNALVHCWPRIVIVSKITYGVSFSKTSSNLRSAHNTEYRAFPGIGTGRASVFFESTLLANVRSFALPIDHLLVALCYNLESRVPFFRFLLRLVLARRSFIFLRCHTVLDSLSPARVLIGSAFASSVPDVGQLGVDLHQSLADRQLGSLGNGLLDDTSSGMPDRRVEEVVLAVPNLEFELIDFNLKRRFAKSVSHNV